MWKIIVDYGRKTAFAYISCLTVLTAGEAVGQDLVELVRRCRTAVVLIDSMDGTGTGFFFRDDGWILTNNHVISSTAIDWESGRRIVRVYCIENQPDGSYREQEPLWASVYKYDVSNDLALLRLEEMPPNKARTDALPLAADQPQVGQECVVIGMPRSGMRWTMRRGEVASIGTYRDIMSRRDRFSTDEELLMQGQVSLVDPDQPIVLSTCNLNPGDSGGPLINRSGEVIAVNYAIPSQAGDEAFAYHVHLSAVREFVADLPAAPLHQPPSLKGEVDRLRPISGDNDSFVLEATYEGTFVAAYFDLDGDRDRTADDIELYFNEDEAMWRQMDMELAVIVDGHIRYFFDLDNDSTCDTIYVAPNSSAEPAIKYSRMDDGSWRFEVASYDFLDSVRFKSERLQSAFASHRQEWSNDLRR